MAKRATLGSFMNFLGQVIRSIEHIILVPLFLAAWGEAIYGEWLTLFSMIAYFSISDLGMNRFVTNKMTKCFAKGDTDEYLRVFKSAFGIYSILALILFILLSLFTVFAPIFDWLDLQLALPRTGTFLLM